MSENQDNGTYPWKTTIRRESNLVEHICYCGVGHPAFGSVDFMTKTVGPSDWGTHGCCEIGRAHV